MGAKNKNVIYIYIYIYFFFFFSFMSAEHLPGHGKARSVTPGQSGQGPAAVTHGELYNCTRGRQQEATEGAQEEELLKEEATEATGCRAEGEHEEHEDDGELWRGD